MKLFDKLKTLPLYLRTNKIAVIVLMVFIFIYLINQDIFLNLEYKRISEKNAAILKVMNRINKIKNSTVSLAQEKNNLYGIKNQITDLKRKLKNAEIMLPKTFRISDLLKNISSNKPADNFILQNISFGKPIKFKGAMALPVSISITGGFNKTVEFIKNINSMKRIFTINYISVKASKKSFPDVKTEIKGFVFSMNGE
jgi:Tfp pilus assembly protein PilO